MEILNEHDIKSIVAQCGFSKVNELNWTINNYSDKLVGYLGEHLRLDIHVEAEGIMSHLKLFVKCIPRADDWKANYLRQTSFFKKEFIMLNELFPNFRNKGSSKWRPQLLFTKEEIFVFEDVTEIGYCMPSHLKSLEYEEIIATVTAIAKFHAQSYIYEEKKSNLLNRPYRIWEDYSEILSEPKDKSWRDTGMKAAIDLLKEFSQYRSKHKFADIIQDKVPKLFDLAYELMKPCTKCRNVVVHRDVWSNNIFLKTLEDGKMHALLIDFQTVLYCGPMIDLSSMIYFNTTKQFRESNINAIIEYYYCILSQELRLENIDVKNIVEKHILFELYKESLVFGMTQAALIVPVIAMTDAEREEYFENPEYCAKFNIVSRSQELIRVAKENENYRYRVIELLDDLVEKFVLV